MAGTRTLLLLLADGRFPSGGHAYSAGMEQSVEWGDVSGLGDLEAFVAGRVETTARLAAEVAAMANLVAARPAGSAGPAGSAELQAALDALDVAVDARVASAAARGASREQGRRWTRACRSTWPQELAGADGVLTGQRHTWVVVGAATGLLGVGAGDAASLAVFDVASTPVWAAVRLLGLDPLGASGVLARALVGADDLARASTRAARAAVDGGVPVDTEWISWLSAPLSELAAEAHLRREERLFAS